MTFKTLALPPFALSIAAEGANLRLFLASAPGAAFTLLSSTNLSPPATNWAVLGPMSETAAGQYEFTLPVPATNLLGFFSLRSP